MIRVMLVLLTTAVSVGIPDFEILAGFSGAFGNNMLAFIFVPPLFLRLRQLTLVERASATTPWALETVVLSILFLFGLVMLVMTTIQTVQHLIKDDSAPCGGV